MDGDVGLQQCAADCLRQASSASGQARNVAGDGGVRLGYAPVEDVDVAEARRADAVAARAAGREVVAHAVKFGLQRGLDLAELPLDTLKTFHAGIEPDVYAVLSLRGSLEARKVQGGTAPERVREQIALHKARLG